MLTGKINKKISKIKIMKNKIQIQKDLCANPQFLTIIQAVIFHGRASIGQVVEWAFENYSEYCDMAGIEEEEEKPKSKPNKYFEIVGEIDGETEKLFGSFDRSDCTYEKECEGESWKIEGFKKIRIITVETAEEADVQIYGDDLKTSCEVFRAFAPAFDFELNEQELIADGLENGWLSKAGTDKFLGNPFTHLGA